MQLGMIGLGRMGKRPPSHHAATTVGEIEIRVAEEIDGAVHAGQRNGPHATLETLPHLDSLLK